MTEAKEALSPEEAMGQFRRMRSEAGEVVLKVESLQQMAGKFVEEASETLTMNISKGEEFLAGIQRLVESSEVRKNPLLDTLIQQMKEDLAWFKVEVARVALVKKHYSEMDQLYLQRPRVG